MLSCKKLAELMIENWGTVEPMFYPNSPIASCLRRQDTKALAGVLRASAEVFGRKVFVYLTTEGAEFRAWLEEQDIEAKKWPDRGVVVRVSYFKGWHYDE